MDPSPGVVALIRLAAQTENVLVESVRAFLHHVLTFIHATRLRIFVTKVRKLHRNSLEHF